MTMHRKFFMVLCSVSIGFSLATLPYTIRVSGPTPELAPKSAFAKSDNNGNGGGNGSGGGNDGGNGGGNGNDGGNGKGSDGTSGGKSKGASNKGAKVGKDGTALGVRHDDGMSEEIRDGQYIMKDARGRTIVNRRATTADEKRLQSLIR